MGSLFSNSIFSPEILFTTETPTQPQNTLIDIQTNDGSGWHDLTNYTTNLTISELGIQGISNAQILIEGQASTFNTFLSNPYQLIRIRFKPSSTWQTLFFGYIDDSKTKTVGGTVPERYKLFLECYSGAARLSDDTITMDYYRLQSAISPYNGTEAWTYRKMLNDIFLHPDGVTETGFTISAATNTEGLDHNIETACTWSQQSIFDVIRTICDRLGYDGYYNLTDENSNWQLVIAPYNKASIHTFTGPYKKEPEYMRGSLRNVSNIIYVWGGVDSGVPSDGDRWTEYAVTKYSSNPVWSCTRTGATNTVSDEDNTAFTNQTLRINNKCIKAQTTGSAEKIFTATFNLTNTGVASLVTANRITAITLNLKTFGLGNHNPPIGWKINFFLKDTANNVLFYQKEGTTVDVEENVNLPFGTEPIQPSRDILGNPVYNTGTWYFDGSTSFDWNNIAIFQIQIQNDGGNVDPAYVFGCYIDGLQFVGGLDIEPFDPVYGALYPHHGATLNPAVYDADSLATYGKHVLHVRDSSIASFEQAQAEGARVLTNLKNPNPTLTFTVQPTAVLKPSNVITVNGSLKRIKEVAYNWNASTKMLEATYITVGQLAPLPPIWTDGELGYMRYIVK
jgi:hypothetical protein